MHNHQTTLFTSDDRVVLIAITALWAGALAYGGSHGEWLLAAVLGAGFLAVAAVLARLGGGGTVSQIGLPVMGMSMVALMIHLAQGRTEAHFAVFAFLAITVVYRRALPIIVGAALIAVHHLAFNYLQQLSWGPLCFTAPSFGLVVEHAVYVVAEAAVLILLARRAHADLKRASATNEIRQGADHLQELLTQVRRSAESISTASSEIASGNLDLSHRTEQTASELQQAASSMEQLTGAVRQNAESAQQASQLSASAAEVAERGGTVVNEVVATMNEINTSSKRIADILGVIDGIAFQTNILALNAAVEAARAGEQGRGFAVVASEVRSLAGRSAEAAREIKRLIGASVERVEAGTRLVSDAGTTMQEIVSSVHRVGDIIGEISAASTEQSDRIGNVNAAVAKLDQMTQQNAALVEESAAAAASLKEQAGALSKVVASFQSEPGPAQAQAPTAASNLAPHAAAASSRSTSRATPSATPRATTKATAPRAPTGPGAATAAKAPAQPTSRPAPKPTPSGTARPTPPRTTAAAAAPQPKAAASADADWETF
jgi:methyl-accepting chemotaxis protein